MVINICIHSLNFKCKDFTYNRKNPHFLFFDKNHSILSHFAIPVNILQYQTN
jgi:hypothetical protein